MPLSKYYGGHGAKVMASMKDQYGDEKGERVFYATANKRKSEMASSVNESRRKHSISRRLDKD